MKMNEEVEKSFHVTCVPGRPLMWKRQPTKRDFVFNLSKLDKSTKIFTDDESVPSMGNKTKSVKNGINDTKENLLPVKENLSDLLKTISSQKTGNPCVTKSNKKNLTMKISALKDVGNIHGFRTLNACKNFQTPKLSIPPAVRRLVDIFVPPYQKSVQSTMSHSTQLSFKELPDMSSNDISGMIGLNKSHLSILGNAVSSTIVNNEKTVASMNVTDTADALKIISEEDVKSKNELDENENHHLSVAQSGSGGSKDSGFRSDDILSDLERPSSDVIEREKSISKSLSQMKDDDEMKIPSPEKVADASVSHIIESFDDRNESEGNNLNISTEQNEKIVNTSTLESLSQLTRQSTTMNNSDTQHSLASGNAIPDTKDQSNIKILLLSPIHSTNKNSASNSNNEIYDETGLNMCDVLEKKDGQENYSKTNALQQAGRSSDTATAKSKHSSIRRRIDFKKKSTGLVVHQVTILSEKNDESNSPSSPDSRKRYCLSQDIVKNLKRRKIKQNLSLTILPENRPSFILAPKVKKYGQKKKESSLISRNFPPKVKVLMCRNTTSFKRKMDDITDLEVIFNLLISDDSDEVPKKSVEAENIFNSYRRGVIKDMAHLVCTSVELQTKTKQISKLYGEIQRKGKKLGALIDERHKILHGIANGELRIAE